MSSEAASTSVRTAVVVGIVLVGVVGLAPSTGVSVQSTVPQAACNAATQRSTLPIRGYFALNAGQWETPARFVGEFSGMVVRAEPGAIVVQHVDDGQGAPRLGVVRMRFEGTDLVMPCAGQRAAGELNYFRGSDPSRWRRHVPCFADVSYLGVANGIDLRLYEEAGQFEYDVRLAPDADLTDFVVNCEGVDDLVVEANGDLRMETPLGPLVQLAPSARQLTAHGENLPVTCTFKRLDSHRFGLKVPGRVPGASLLIDPGLTWSTYLGGSGQDRAVAVKMTAAGNPLVLGRTNSPNFPSTAGVYDPNVDSWDATVTCFDPTGSFLVFSTVVGGSNSEVPAALALAADGSIAIGGDSQSTDYPSLPSSYDSTFSGGLFDACVTVLAADGSDITFSTLLGGSCAEEVFGIGFTSEGKLVVAGDTCSADFPVTPAALDPSYGGLGDGFVAWFDPSLAGAAQLVHSTLLGTAGQDHILDLTIAVGDEPIVIGQTSAADFPTTPGAFDVSPGQSGLSGFVTRLAPDGSSLVASTHFKTGIPLRVTTDGATVLVCGWAQTSFPVTPGAYDTVLNGGQDCLLARLDGQLSQLQSATYVGGQANDDPLCLAVDADGSIIFAGITSSGNYPTTPGAFDTNGSPATRTMVSRLSSDMSALLYSSFLGGGGPTSSWANSVAVIGPSDVVLVGEGAVTGFPVTPGAFDTTFNGGDLGGADGYVTRMLLKATWNALGGALAGSNGTPVLAGSGNLAGGDPVSLLLRHAKPNALSALIIGLGLLDAPFKGGVVVPTPDVLILGLPVDGQGMLTLNSTWPTGLPPGFSFFAQCWIPDPAGPKGFAASNGLEGLTP